MIHPPDLVSDTTGEIAWSIQYDGVSFLVSGFPTTWICVRCAYNWEIWDISMG